MLSPIQIARCRGRTKRVGDGGGGVEGGGVTGGGGGVEGGVTGGGVEADGGAVGVELGMVAAPPWQPAPDAPTSTDSTRYDHSGARGAEEVHPSSIKPEISSRDSEKVSEAVFAHVQVKAAARRSSKIVPGFEPLRTIHEECRRQPRIETIPRTPVKTCPLFPR